MQSGVVRATRATLADDVAALLNNTTLGANLHAFQNDFVPSPLATIGDFTECDFTGYAKKTALTAFTKAYDSASGDYRVYLPTQQVFTAGTIGATQTVAGCYVTDSTDVTLYGWQKFDTPYVMRQSGDAVIVDVELRVPVNTMQVGA